MQHTTKISKLIYHPFMEKEEDPIKMGYDPEFDTGSELDPDAASYYLLFAS